MYWRWIPLSFMIIYASYMIIQVWPIIWHLNFTHIRKFVKALSKFRVSNHCLEIERGRHEFIPRENRLCKYCTLLNQNCIEDEFHFLCICMLYNDLRLKYVPNVKNFNRYEFSLFMQTKDPHILINLSKYLFFSNVKRSNYLDL